MRPLIRVTPARRAGPSENAEFVAIALLLQRWDDIAPWLMEELFADETCRRAFLAVADSGGSIEVALEHADPEARELLERAAVADVDADPEVEARSLITAAVRRELARRTQLTDPDSMRETSDAQRRIKELDQTTATQEAAEALLGWLATTERGARVSERSERTDVTVRFAHWRTPIADVIQSMTVRR